MSKYLQNFQKKSMFISFKTNSFFLYILHLLLSAISSSILNQNAIFFKSCIFPVAANFMFITLSHSKVYYVKNPLLYNEFSGPVFRPENRPYCFDHYLIITDPNLAFPFLKLYKISVVTTFMLIIFSSFEVCYTWKSILWSVFSGCIFVNMRIALYFEHISLKTTWIQMIFFIIQ